MKLKHVLLLSFLFFATLSQAQDKIFEKYSERDNVVSIYISKAMFKMMSGMVDVKDLPIEDLSEKLESLQVLSSQDPNEANKMNKDFSAHVRKHHEELMRIKEGKTNVRLYINKKGDKVQELLLFAQTDDDFSIIRLLGNFTMKEIKEFVEKTEKQIEK